MVAADVAEKTKIMAATANTAAIRNKKTLSEKDKLRFG
jgi:hypothetical protein